VVDGGDPAQLVAALRTLATAVEMRREMGRQARAWAAEHDWRAVRDRTLAALASIR
jgi:glycosyltransferase involved in cell wall biosynthesis